MSMKFTHSIEGETVEMALADHLTVSEALEGFKRFLLAIGYQPGSVRDALNEDFFNNNEQPKLDDLMTREEWELIWREENEG